MKLSCIMPNVGWSLKFYSKLQIISTNVLNKSKINENIANITFYICKFCELEL